MRKYYWKFMMAKCQQLDFYTNGEKGGAGYFVNYDPEGVNPFARTAPVLRAFWNKLTDYGNLWFEGRIASGPGDHQLVLSSDREAVAYCSSGTGDEDVRFESGMLELRDLAVADGEYIVEIVDPETGVSDTRSVSIGSGKADLMLPAFTDDIAVHVYR